MLHSCPDCDGGAIFGKASGQCSKCHGERLLGTVVSDISGHKPQCDLCHGTGKCVTCRGQGLIEKVLSKPKRPNADAEFNPFDDKTAVRLHCPKCGDVDWFEWKLFGKLTDPMCGHQWYVGTGVYTVQQIRAIFGAANRTGKYMSSGVPNVQGAWIGRALGWFCGLVFGIAFRLEAALFAIPIQAALAICHANKESRHAAGRITVLIATALTLGTGLYLLRQASAGQSFTGQPATSNAVSPSGTVRTTTGAGVASPTFDCGKAHSKVEVLICRDDQLAALEVGMVTAYRRALARLESDSRHQLAQNHLAWFRNYAKICNRSPDDQARTVCVAGFLSQHTAELDAAR